MIQEGNIFFINLNIDFNDVETIPNKIISRFKSEVIDMVYDANSSYWIYFQIENKFKICFHSHLMDIHYISFENDESFEKAKEIAEYLEEQFAGKNQQ